MLVYSTINTKNFSIEGYWATWTLRIVLLDVKSRLTFALAYLFHWWGENVFKQQRKQIWLCNTFQNIIHLPKLNEVVSGSWNSTECLSFWMLRSAVRKLKKGYCCWASTEILLRWMVQLTPLKLFAWAFIQCWISPEYVFIVGIYKYRIIES